MDKISKYSIPIILAASFFVAIYLFWPLLTAEIILNILIFFGCVILFAIWRAILAKTGVDFRTLDGLKNNQKALDSLSQTLKDNEDVFRYLSEESRKTRQSNKELIDALKNERLRRNTD